MDGDQTKDSRDRVVSLVLVSGNVPLRVARAGRAVMQRCWLGVLAGDRLRALDEAYYTDAGQYRTDEWNERGLFPWESKIVEEHFSRDGKLAVLACGGGREVLALRNDGYDAIGFESHPAL